MFCKCKIVLLLLGIVMDPAFIPVRKLHFFVFGIQACCFAEAFGWEPSFSLVQFRFACFIALNYVFCSLKNIGQPQNLIAFLSPKLFKDFPNCLSLCLFDKTLYDFAQFVFNTVWVWYLCSILKLCLIDFLLCESIRLWVSSLWGYFMKVFFCAILGWVKLMCWICNWKYIYNEVLFLKDRSVVMGMVTCKWT